MSIFILWYSLVLLSGILLLPLFFSMIIFDQFSKDTDIAYRQKCAYPYLLVDGAFGVVHVLSYIFNNFQSMYLRPYNILAFNGCRVSHVPGIGTTPIESRLVTTMVHGLSSYTKRKYLNKFVFDLSALTRWICTQNYCSISYRTIRVQNVTLNRNIRIDRMEKM